MGLALALIVLGLVIWLLLSPVIGIILIVVGIIFLIFGFTSTPRRRYY